MQTVSAAFTAQERDTVRRISHSLQASWKKEDLSGNVAFAIGVSAIGGTDVIGANPGAIGSPGNYRYFDESDYVTSLEWDRGLNMPTGGLAKALASARLSNTTGRFTPRYMGGNSELFTAIQNRVPVLISAGFNVGSDENIAQFSGVVVKQPELDTRRKELRLQMADYIDFFQNRYLDQGEMFTSLRTDEVMENLLQGTLGMSTSQYRLDTGINVIPFGLFEPGTRMSDIFHQLAEAENGHFYQDEEGKFRFENRQHWDSSPFNQVQRVVLTGQVLNAQAPNDDHLINVVEINSSIYQKQQSQTVFTLPAQSSIPIGASSYEDKFFEFIDPVLQLTDPTSTGTNSYFKANSKEDGSGTDLSSYVTVTNLGTFAKAVKYRISSSYTTGALYITQFVLGGRAAKKIANLYYREQDDSSVTANQERVLRIDNPYIQDENWAGNLSRMLLSDYSEVENLQVVTIRAIPELQLGDLISWQGRYWRVFDIKTTLDNDTGFIQELTLLQRTPVSYFRIGISAIGGDDYIAA